jgi:homoserine/homoserine lactone efflux protein
MSVDLLPPIDLLFGFSGAVVVLMLIPGPNVALTLANTVAFGRHHGFLTILGTSAAMVVHLAVTAAGMTALLGLMGEWFDTLRWAGVGYLVILGIRAWRAPVADPGAITARPGHLVARGFAVSLTNPKVLLFYGAFFPQFLDPAGDVAAQMAILSMLFIAIAVSVDSLWVCAASGMRPWLAGRGRLVNKLSGGLFMGAGLGLALMRR